MLSGAGIAFCTLFRTVEKNAKKCINKKLNLCLICFQGSPLSHNKDFAANPTRKLQNIRMASVCDSDKRRALITNTVIYCRASNNLHFCSESMVPFFCSCGPALKVVPGCRGLSGVVKTYSIPRMTFACKVSLLSLGMVRERAVCIR